MLRFQSEALAGVNNLHAAYGTSTQKLAKMAGIDEGEAPAILLAKQKQARQVLADQTEVRMVAERYAPPAVVCSVLISTLNTPKLSQQPNEEERIQDRTAAL